MAEADLALVAELLPDDVDLDPAAERFDVDEPAQRALIVYQSYWKAFGEWSPTRWRLNFMVYQGKRFVGTQELEGNNFPVLRTVDSASFLLPDERGRGYGKQMRVAVLALAFDYLDAQAAITSAYHDNDASLGVSRSLGYTPNGESFEVRGDGADTLTHLRMVKTAWKDSGLADQVQVSGFEPCRPLFGI